MAKKHFDQLLGVLSPESLSKYKTLDLHLIKIPYLIIDVFNFNSTNYIFNLGFSWQLLVCCCLLCSCRLPGHVGESHPRSR